MDVNDIPSEIKEIINNLYESTQYGPINCL
jgi:hypothetical protein